MKCMQMPVHAEVKRGMAVEQPKGWQERTRQQPDALLASLPLLGSAAPTFFFALPSPSSAALRRGLSGAPSACAAPCGVEVATRMICC